MARALTDAKLLREETRWVIRAHDIYTVGWGSNNYARNGKGLKSLCCRLRKT